MWMVCSNGSTDAGNVTEHKKNSGGGNNAGGQAIGVETGMREREQRYRRVQKREASRSPTDAPPKIAATRKRGKRKKFVPEGIKRGGGVIAVPCSFALRGML